MIFLLSVIFFYYYFLSILIIICLSVTFFVFAICIINLFSFVCFFFLVYLQMCEFPSSVVKYTYINKNHHQQQTNTSYLLYFLFQWYEVCLICFPFCRTSEVKKGDGNAQKCFKYDLEFATKLLDLVFFFGIENRTHMLKITGRIS